MLPAEAKGKYGPISTIQFRKDKRVECGEAAVTVRLFVLTCGYLAGNLGYLMEGGEVQAELPVPHI
jgi:hypothetical protein